MRKMKLQITNGAHHSEPGRTGHEPLFRTLPSVALLLVLLLALSVSGCSSQPAEPTATVAPKPVVITVLEEQTTDVTLDYVGIVNTDPTRNLAFKSGGKVLAVHVAKGQEVHAGDLLAELDTTELAYAKDAADAQLTAARAQYAKAAAGADAEDIRNAELNVEKAQAAHDFAVDTLTKLEQLLADGIESAYNVDQARLGVQIREKELTQAQEVLQKARNGAKQTDLTALSAQIDQAQTNVQARQTLLDDAVMTAVSDGYVIDVLYDPGELVGAGYPIVILGSNARTAHVGITGDDLEIIRTGMKARINRTRASNSDEGIGDAEIVLAEVTRISEIPDTKTRTYDTELTLPDARFPLGATLDVRFLTGTVKGIWIPTSTVLSEGGEYVLLERDGLVVRAPVAILESTGSNVRVTGLSAGDHLISEGIRRLNEGDPVILSAGDGQEAAQ